MADEVASSGRGVMQDIRHSLARWWPWSNGRRPSRRTVIVLLAIAAIILGDASWRLWDSYHAFTSATTTLRTVRAQLLDPAGSGGGARLSEEQFAALREDMAQVSTDLQRGHDRLGYFRWLLIATRPLPYIGDTASHLPALAALGAEMADIGSGALGTAEPLLRDSDPLPVRAREVLVGRAPEVKRDFERFAQTAPEIQRLSRVHWVGPAAPAGDMLQQLALYTEDIEGSRATLEVLRTGFDTLIGWDRPVRYAILGQNDHEIRATGGYIGTLGFLTLERGRIVSQEFRDSNAYDAHLIRRTAPYPIQRFLGIGPWYIRDSNTSPDFPQSAQQTMEFLIQDSGQQVDGVIAVDSVFTTALMAVLGPVQVDGVDQPLTAGDWIRRMEERLASRDQVADPQAQATLQPVLGKLILGVRDARAAQMVPLARAFQRGVAGRHVQAFAIDRRAQQLLARVHADGAFTGPADAAFIGIVEDNYSYSKVGPAIRRDLSYVVRADGGGDLVFTWSNEVNQPTELRYPRMLASGILYNPVTRTYPASPGVYGTFVRVVLPPSARVSASSGFSDLRYEFDSTGRAVVSGWMVVKPGERQTASLTLDHVQTEQQDLFFWKQGGWTQTHLRIAKEGAAAPPLFDGAFEADLLIQPKPRTAAR